MLSLWPCNWEKDHVLFAKFALKPLSVGEVLSLASCYNQGATPQTGPSEEKEVDVLGRNTEGPSSLFEVRAANQERATSPTAGEVLSLVSC